MCRKKMVPVGDLYERVHNSRKNGQKKNYEYIAKLCRTKIGNVKRWFDTGSIPEAAYILIDLWNNREIRISNINYDEALKSGKSTWNWTNKHEDNLPLLDACDNSAIDDDSAELANNEDHELKEITLAKFFIKNAFFCLTVVSLLRLVPEMLLLMLLKKYLSTEVTNHVSMG